MILLFRLFSGYFILWFTEMKPQQLRWERGREKDMMIIRVYSGLNERCGCRRCRVRVINPAGFLKFGKLLDTPLRN